MSLRPPTFAEMAAMEGYREAIKGALLSADSTADRVVTAAFSVATAYGALLALVTPKGDSKPITLALPFGALALAVVLAMIAQSKGVSLDATNLLTDIEGRVRDTVDAKRWLTRSAVAALAVGLVVAGAVVAVNFGQSASGDTAVQLALTPRGQVVVAETCGRVIDDPVQGSISLDELDSEFVSIQLTHDECPTGSGSIELATKLIDAIAVQHSVT